MRIQIDSSEYVTLKMPMRLAEKHGIRFLKEHGEWICESMAELPGVPRLEKHLVKHPRLALAGRWHALELNFQDGRCSYVVDDENRKVTFSLSGKVDLEEQLLQLLKAVARHYLPRRVLDFEAKVGVKSHGITIRDQKSRWGSCSETGGISLNWRLILVSPKLQDYVILHELAHIRHFDHSSDFHATLELLDPRAREHARQLHNEAAGVFSLGRAIE